MLSVTRSYNVSCLETVFLHFLYQRRISIALQLKKIKYPEAKQHKKQNLGENKPNETPC